VFLKRLTIANRFAETRKILVFKKQLADMVCGTVARSYSGKQDAEVYRPLISHREIYVQVWPR